MKNIILFFSIVILSLSCNKIKNSKYTVVAEKPNSQECILEVNDIEYRFSNNSTQKEIVLGEYEVGSASLDYVSTGTDNMTLSLYQDGHLKATVSGDNYIWIVFSNDSDIKTSQSSYGSSGGSSGSSGGSGSTYCGAPTKDGTPCKRKVSGGGYCWQHK